jgi:LmbE family N-acetylglucosaminyl deacetylase
MNLPTFLRGRVALVAAHPDDETVSAGACIAQLSELAIIHITDGAPRNMQDALSHGFASRGEYAAARRQEFLAALCVGRVTPFETAAFDVADQEASFHLAAISRDLARLFEQMAIETVLVHPYEGGHPDHDATAFAVHMAARLRGSGAPKIAEFTSYHLRDGEIETGVFLPAEESGEVACPLNDEERERKRRMLECFRSQQAT